MRIVRSLMIAGAVALSLAPTTSAKAPAYTDPQQADEDFALQGEYVGAFATDEGEKKFGVQVIALGDGKFRAVGHPGGLPGAGTKASDDARMSAEGQRQNGTVIFKRDKGKGVLANGTLTLYDAEGRKRGELKRVDRKSPTLNKEPPQGAVVLFDGTSADNWKGGRLTDDGLLMQGCTSQETFGDHSLHIEFRLPYQPHDRGQQRGNSGVYLQGRYEVQMLDSFGLEGKDNECGGLYSIKAPDINMCYPPFSWQTYDIDFTAAKYDEQSNLTANPRITVRHNGVVIHDDVELPGDRSSRAAPVKPGPQPGPVYLQDHGNPVRYRNIWAVRKK